MKNLFFALAVTMISVGAFADSRLEDSAGFSRCGGEVQLRSFPDANRGGSSYALKFNGVSKCSNVRLSTGKSYKLTSEGGFQDKSFTLSDEAVNEAKSYRGLVVTVESNSGSTSEEVSVRIQERQVPAPQPTPDYESTGWN